MICRIWRGWRTTVPNATAYEELLRSTVIPGIEARAIPGFHSIDMMRRELVGEDHEIAPVPAAARAVLSRFDDRAVHYNLYDRHEQAKRS